MRVHFELKWSSSRFITPFKGTAVPMMMNFICRWGEFEQEAPPSECLINGHPQVTLLPAWPQLSLCSRCCYMRKQSSSSHPQMILLQWLLCWKQTRVGQVRKKKLWAEPIQAMQCFAIISLLVPFPFNNSGKYHTKAGLDINSSLSQKKF